MGKSFDEFASGCIGTLFMWGLGGYGTFLLARAAWRKISANSGVILGGLAWIGIIVVGLLIVIVFWATFLERAEVRKLAAPHFKEIEEALSIQTTRIDESLKRLQARRREIAAKLDGMV